MRFKGQIENSGNSMSNRLKSNILIRSLEQSTRYYTTELLRGTRDRQDGKLTPIVEISETFFYCREKVFFQNSIIFIISVGTATVI